MRPEDYYDNCCTNTRQLQFECEHQKRRGYQQDARERHERPCHVACQSNVDCAERQERAQRRQPLFDRTATSVRFSRRLRTSYTSRMTELIIADDGIFGPDLRARTELPMSIDVFVARGGTPPRRKPEPVVREVKSGEVIECGTFTVEARAVIHAQPVLECFAYRLDHEGASFVYSGDAGPCAAMAELARNCDVLVHMCHFLSGTALSAEMEKRNMGHLELAQLAKDADVRNLVVSHVTEQMDLPGIRERIIREMAKIYAGNLFFGEDLMEVPTGDPVPRRLD